MTILYCHSNHIFSSYKYKYLILVCFPAIFNLCAICYAMSLCDANQPALTIFRRFKNSLLCAVLNHKFIQEIRIGYCNQSANIVSTSHSSFCFWLPLQYIKWHCAITTVRVNDTVIVRTCTHPSTHTLWLLLPPLQNVRFYF